MRGRLLLRLALLAVFAVARCASAPPAPAVRDRFPLDPREGLTGPFDAGIEEGWRALLSGEADRAEKEFAGASGAASRRAAAIGRIAALLETRRVSDAIVLCAEELPTGEPTLPLLVACGEARARAGEPVEASELYDRAVSRAPERRGLSERAEDLRSAAVALLLDEAQMSASEGRREQARARLEHALALAPRDGGALARAAEVECAAGEKARALGYYREALALGGVPPSVEERAGDLALELGEDAMAVSVFDALAARDPAFRDRAAQARLAFRIGNWPDAERRAARARRLTRAGAASLAWWMFSEVREARVTSGTVASDVLDRGDGRAMMRAISLGLIDVDNAMHRARPDAALTRAAAARFLLRLSAALRRPFGPEPECLQTAAGVVKAGGAEAIRVAARCGLLSESGGSVVGGAEFTRGLDRLRSLFPAGEATHRD
ncbi:MAG: hypothetical protein WD451_14385 [Thermoanaerobaculia bacterium]